MTHIKRVDEMITEKVNLKNIRGTRRINYDDDLVVVYNGDGEIEYKGIDDFNPYKDDDWVWDESIKGYRCGDYIQICIDPS